MIRDNDYLWAFEKLEGNRQQLSSIRDGLVYVFAWAIPNPEAIEAIREHAPRIVEIGAGTGYWAYLLNKAGCDIVAFDSYDGFCNHGYWFDVRKGEGVQCLNGYHDRALMLCWPPYSNPMAYEYLSAYQGDTLVYIGEGAEGCTGDRDFHQLLDQAWEPVEKVDIPRWYGIHDSLTIYRRKLSA